MLLDFILGFCLGYIITLGALLIATEKFDVDIDILHGVMYVLFGVYGLVALSILLFSYGF